MIKFYSDKMPRLTNSGTKFQMTLICRG